MWAWAFAAGMAFAWPDRVVHTEDLESAIGDVVVSRDGSSAAFVTRGGLMLLDLSDWSIVSAAPCASVGGLAVDPQNDAGFVAGCSDGSLAWFELADGLVSVGATATDLTDEEILGLASNRTLIFGLIKNPVSDANPLVVAYSTETGAPLTNGYPTFLWESTVQDLEANDLYLLASHGGGNLTKVAAGSGAASQQLGSPAGAEVSDVVTVGNNRFMVAGGEAGVLEFQTESNALSLVLTEMDEATAIAANDDEGWFAVADDGTGEVLFHSFAADSGTPQSILLGAVDLPDDGRAVREFGVLDGYLLAGTDDGKLHVLTERPWVDVTRTIPSNALNGEEVSITFVSDTAGDWEIRRGGTNNGDGVVVASGTIEADGSEVAVVTVDEGFAEGKNRLRIVVEDSDGLFGHDSTSVSVDNPPSTVPLVQRDLGFGNGRLILELPGIDDEDLSHYMLYASSVEFSAEEYASEGPSFSGVSSDKSGAVLNLPRRIAASPGEDKTITIEPLTNGATYFVAVRAYDAAGQEGRMSNVVSETPRETFGAADLADDQGGFACSASSVRGVGLLALCGVALGVLRRRSALAVAVVVCGVVSGSARASDSEWPQSGSSVSDFVGGSFEARYSSLDVTDENLTQVFGSDGHNALWLEVGPTLFDLIELTGALGYYSETGSRVDADGNSSAEDDTMLAIPLTVDATFRLDVLPEQLIVPFAGMGYDYWLWQESWTGGNKVQGGKKGTHTTMGAHLLLDLFQPQRASRLQATSGITDTYITVEYRQQLVGEDAEGLTFSADVFSVGLKLDY